MHYRSCVEILPETHSQLGEHKEKIPHKSCLKPVSVVGALSTQPQHPHHEPLKANKWPTIQIGKEKNQWVGYKCRVGG